MQVFFILFSVYFAIYQYINSKYLYRTHVIIKIPPPNLPPTPYRTPSNLLQNTSQSPPNPADTLYGQELMIS